MANSNPEGGMDLEAIVASMAQELFHYARVLTGEASQAEDVLQDTLVAWLEQAARGGKVESPRAWLFAVLRRKALVRSLEQPDAAELARHLSTAVEADPAERLMLAEAFSALDHGTQEVVVLHCWEGLTFAEIAGVLRVPRGTVLSRYHRGIQELRRRFGVDVELQEGASGHEHAAATIPG